ncbi:MAG: hypothetical protein V2A71_05860 [Candidatus Eisenbacteria bacterium]
MLSGLNRSESNLVLTDGSKVAVIGAGPAGAFFSYFLLDMAKRVGIELELDVYESRDFSKAGPAGCNMCGGIVSESLVQTLATEGINLPASVVQRGIDSYLLHTDVGNARIETPLHEMRIAAVFRGRGPRDVKDTRWGSFDEYLEKLIIEGGARLVGERVEGVTFSNGKPHVEARGSPPREYDLLVVAAGVNSGVLGVFERLGLGYTAPATTRTFIREYYLGEETVGRVLGSSMHVFLLNIPRLEFAAIIPKGDYVTVCMLGQEIDNALVQAFLSSPEVKECLPAGWHCEEGSCQCWPKINVRGVARPFADRIVFVGDSAVTRLYKDGIGAAYRTAKSAAATAVLHGVGAAEFERHYWPTCKAIANDNVLGRLTFRIVRQLQTRRFARRAVLRMTLREQRNKQSSLRMSKILWDMFTGSAPYADIFGRAMHPGFWGRFLWNVVAATIGMRGTGR